MAATALIKLSQGILIPPAGQALAGAGGVSFTIENASPVDIQSWEVQLVYVPPGSTVVVGLVATSPNTSVVLGAVVPDLVPGCYRIRLRVWPQTNYQGAPSEDIRNFAVPSANGVIFPPYQQLPPKLPILGSGAPGEKPDELNFGGQPYGWDGYGNEGLVLDFMRKTDALLSGGGGGGGGFTDIPINQIKTIAAGEQVIFYGPMTIEGTLRLSGSLVSMPVPAEIEVVAEVTSGPTAVPNNSQVPVDPNAGALTIELPNTGTPGQVVTIKNVTSSLNVITVDGMGRKMDGANIRTLTTAYENLQVRRKRNQNWDVL